MANRVPGVFSFAANFETLIAAPLDARGTVVNYSELTDGSLPYPYLGMVVAVTNDIDPTKNGLYLLKAAPATTASNWYKLTENADAPLEVIPYITGVTFNGTNQVINLSDGNSFTTDINDVTLAGSQYSIGISNHAYQLITTNDTQISISGETYNVANVAGESYVPAKTNIIIVSGITSATNFLLDMPQLLQTEAGVTYKIIAKDISGVVDNKYFMVYSGVNRIIGANIKSKVGDAYFVPLETLESLELVWDGSDYIITNIIKQAYTSLNAKDFLSLNTLNDPLFNAGFIERNIANII